MRRNRSWSLIQSYNVEVAYTRPRSRDRNGYEVTKELRAAVVFRRVAALGLALNLACASLGDASPAVVSSESALHIAANGTLELQAPVSLALLVNLPSYRAPNIPEDENGLLAYYFATHVYAHPEQKPRTLGLVRRGTLLRATGPVSGPGCDRGQWYALAERGYACVGRGFTLASSEQLAKLRQPRPNLARAVPFTYGKVSSRNALRYYRIPNEHEEQSAQQALVKGEALPEYVADKLDGDFFVAIDREETAGKRNYYRTVLGRYLRVDEVTLKTGSDMHGELLGAEVQLPLAFVYADAAVPLLRRKAGAVESVGSARKHARFGPARPARWHEKPVVVSSEGYAVELQHVRIARRIARPKSVSAEQAWLHVDLGQQTLVAYRGDQPIFATLVSTGRDGFETPTGLFRISEKHKTRTMRGADSAGVFEVAEVPWTMFYRGNYALHGAYWHDDFGKVRSHGCINLAPLDARWIFHFTEGAIPSGWHALRHLRGTPLLVTR